MINGMPFQARSDCKYGVDIYWLADEIERSNNFTKEQRAAEPLVNELNLYRNMMQQSLWFFVFFAMKNPLANHPFIVNACRDVEREQGDSLEVWARDHLKTTIISVGRQCQKILNDPERRIGIFSATRPLAVKIQSMIRDLFESPFLYSCFPDILYENPKKDAPKWSEAPEGGLIVKRNGFYKEPTVSAWGLIEGTPTGYHLTDLIFDDIVTVDTLSSEVMSKVRDGFDMAENLGTRDRQITVVGTYYRHNDPLTYIRDKRDTETSAAMFPEKKKAATVDGTIRGASVFQPEAVLTRKRSGNLYIFCCQMLLDPTPRGQEKLNKNDLNVVSKRELPLRLYKFMIIDGAGDVGRRIDRKADPWSMMVLGVEPYRGDDGMNRIYIMDMLIREMDLPSAQSAATEMYCRNGRILKLGVEKVGMSTTEIHIAAALKARGRHVSIERGNLEILKPGGRSKEYRIESAIALPLKNGRWHILDTVPRDVVQRLEEEMDKFPAWHDDGLDGMSYIYDLIKGYRFGELVVESGKSESNKWDRAFNNARKTSSAGWQGV